MNSMVSRFRKALNGLKLLRAYFTLVQDLGKVDSVLAALANMENSGELDKMMEGLKGDHEFEALLKSRPSLGKYNLHELAKLPAGTVGQVFAETMLKMGYDPNFFSRAEIHSDGQYMSARLRETHDLWHVVTGFDTSPAGEGGLQAMYTYQVRGSLSAFLISAAMLNALLYDRDDIYNRVEQLVMGWRLGQRSRRLLNVQWEEMMSRPLSQVRRELNLPVEGVYQWYRGMDGLAAAA